MVNIDSDSHPDLTFDIVPFCQKACILKDIKSAQLSITFLSKDEMITLNTTYLNHTYLTDIITFNLSEDEIDGDLYISLDQVRENATEEDHSFEDEVKFVLLHGILHLLDYDDDTDENRDIMFKEQARLMRCINETGF